MRRALLLALLAPCVSCPEKPAPPGRSASRAASALEACVDAQLSRQKLNPYGDPTDTVYAGGSPLFDEKSGATRDRLELVRAKHPEIDRACPRP